MAQFFTNEAVSLEKQIETIQPSVETPEEQIEDKYEVTRCVEWINRGDYKKICLQFPDHLLCDSSKIARRLQEKLKRTVYILGDTAYESCCVDYVAAAHIEADAIIHFGPTCFSKPSGDIPSLFIHEKHSFDVEQFKIKFRNTFSGDVDVMIVLDTPFEHLKGLITESTNRTNVRVLDVELNLEDSICLYIGRNDRKLMNFNLIYKPKELHYFDPYDNPTIQKYEMDKRILKKRNFLIEKVKDSITIGIIIGTLAVKHYKAVIDRLKQLIKANGKKYYLLSVGKPNVAKLANFPEMDIYVLISCAMNEIFDSRDFYKPLVTPYDLEIALNPLKNSSTSFTYDFDQFLTNDIQLTPNEESDVSLISGKIRTFVNEDVNEGDLINNGEIALKTVGTIALNNAHGAGFLAERSWKGLERNLNESEVKLAEDGRKGIAQGYVNELDL